MTEEVRGDPFHPPILMINDMPVMLDARVAEAFEDEVKNVNQAVSRNPEKFDDRHAFRLTAAQRDFLRSQNVISKPEGRGGSQVPPMVYTQKGVARLATILRTPKALEATDLIIDVFTEVYVQIANGSQTIAVTNPNRLLPSPDIKTKIARIKDRLLDQIDTLMQAPISATGATVKEELSDIGATLYDDLKARLKRKGLENDKLEAEVLKLLEEVQTLRQDRAVNARKAELEIEAQALENIKTKMALIRENLALLEDIEPNALVELNSSFLPGAAPLLQLPKPDDGEEK